MSDRIRSGLITAEMTVTEQGVIFLGPLCFDDDTVCESGRWEARIDPTDESAVADALEAIYVSEYVAWCDRKSDERAKATPEPRRQIRFGGMHTPCPALWAGR